MGASVGWVAVRGKTSERVCGELGLRRTGERGKTPELPFAGAAARDGWYLVVADGGYEEIEAIVDPPRLSTGCEMISFEMEEHGGYRCIEGWVNGSQRWSVGFDPCGGSEDPFVTGQVPPEYASARARCAADPVATPLDLPIYLAEELTGYSYGMGIATEADVAEPFETLELPETGALLSAFTARLTEALAAEGFTAVPGLDDWRVWFTAPTAIPGITAAIAAHITRTGYGGIEIDGYASLFDPEVGRVLADLPRSTWLDWQIAGDRRFGEIDDLSFSQLDQRWGPGRERRLGDTADIEGAVSWFMEFVRGPIPAWLTRWPNPTALLDSARTRDKGVRFNAARLRGAIVWCLLHDQPVQAADLMHWYLRPFRSLRDPFGPFDSRSRATALDLALRERFPEFARARS
ncbi:hypothetical protein OHB26_25645 [Nocardia sp. NBC_01503]|uniref:hypothetical protein n=1 Tax=Nocardia sp. NBC_01503 TaxID=2975997 RepID=UPI002E7B6CFA|nr:hypothetical protein [Nocardia sp. NBC_01503]WTL30313.1 hypothetical protein OHB26_25645 [Nocardia sp. NBC_01503]